MGASGLVVAVATVALVVELALVVLRFVNIGVVNYKIRLFLIAVSHITVDVRIIKGLLYGGGGCACEECVEFVRAI